MSSVNCNFIVMRTITLLCHPQNSINLSDYSRSKQKTEEILVSYCILSLQFPSSSTLMLSGWGWRPRLWILVTSWWRSPRAQWWAGVLVLVGCASWEYSSVSTTGTKLISQHAERLKRSERERGGVAKRNEWMRDGREREGKERLKGRQEEWRQKKEKKECRKKIEKETGNPVLKLSDINRRQRLRLRKDTSDKLIKGNCPKVWFFWLSHTIHEPC